MIDLSMSDLFNNLIFPLISSIIILILDIFLFRPLSEIIKKNEIFLSQVS